jgi:hypothetical protein
MRVFTHGDPARRKAPQIFVPWRSPIEADGSMQRRDNRDRRGCHRRRQLQFLAEQQQRGEQLWSSTATTTFTCSSSTPIASQIR